MATTKVTKKELFTQVLNVIEDSSVENRDELAEFIAAQIETLNARAEKAKARAAEKRLTSDAFTNAVLAVITDEPASVDVITAKVVFDEVEVTKAKVVARLTKLKEMGKIVSEKDKKTTVYRLAEMQ